MGTSRSVCSSSLSLSTVLSEVKQLKGKLEEWEYLDEEDDEPDEKNGDKEMFMFNSSKNHLSQQRQFEDR